MVDDKTRDIYGTGRVATPKPLTEREIENPYRGASRTPYDVTPVPQPKPQDVYRDVNPMFSTAYDELSKASRRGEEAYARESAMNQEVPDMRGYKSLMSRLGPKPYSTSGGIEDREVPLQEQIRRAKMGFDTDRGTKREKLAAQIAQQNAVNSVYARANQQVSEHNRAGQDAYKLALADRTGRANTFLGQDQNQRRTLDQLLRNAGYEQQNTLNYNTEGRRLDQSAANDAQRRYWEDVKGTSGVYDKYGNMADEFMASLSGGDPRFLTDGGTAGADAAARASAVAAGKRQAPGKHIEDYVASATASFSPELKDHFAKNSAAQTQFRRGVEAIINEGRTPEPQELRQLATTAAITGGRMLYNPETQQMEQVDGPLSADQNAYNRSTGVKFGQAVANTGKFLTNWAVDPISKALGGEGAGPYYPGFGNVLQTPSGQQYYDFNDELTPEQLQVLGFADPL